MATRVFEVSPDYAPTGDQPKAIAELGTGLGRGDRFQFAVDVGTKKTTSIGIPGVAVCE